MSGRARRYAHTMQTLGREVIRRTLTLTIAALLALGTWLALSSTETRIVETPHTDQPANILETDTEQETIHA